MKALVLSMVLGLVGCAAAGEEPTTEQLATEAPEIGARPRVGSGQVDGVVDDRPIDVADARIFAGILSTRDATRRGLRIVLADHAGVCSRPDVTRPNERTLGLEIELGAGARELAPGTYGIDVPSETVSVYARLDTMSATCSSKTFLSIGGSLTIEEATAARVTGSFELTLGREKVRGRFDAVVCDAPVAPPLTTRCER